MKGIVIALVSCMFLALESVFSKVLLRHMPPIVLAALSSTFAAIVLFAILEVENKAWEIFKLRRREFIVLLSVGLISGVLAQLLYVTGLNESTATNAVLLTRLNSLLIALMGIVLIREKLGWHHIFGAILMVGGIVIIATKNFTAEVKPTQGDGLLILAAICWASANILMKKYLTKLPPEVIVVYYYAFSGAMLLGISYRELPTSLTSEAIVYLTGLVLLVSVIGRYLWYWSFEHTSACNVGLASLSMPLFGVLYAVVLLQESPQPFQILGGLMVFSGLVAVEFDMVCHPDTEHRLKRHHPHH
jgi:drug/metabolite transporter (DMT)-like permease